MAGKAVGFAPIKINMVAMRGVNEDAIDSMMSFCIEHKFVLRLIEAMPIRATGRDAAFLDLGPIRSKPGKKWVASAGGGNRRRSCTLLVEHRRQYKRWIYYADVAAFLRHLQSCAAGSRWHPVSLPGAEREIRVPPFVAGRASDTELDATIRTAITFKPQKHEFRERPEKNIRFMAQTGG